MPPKRKIAATQADKPVKEESIPDPKSRRVRKPVDYKEATQSEINGTERKVKVAAKPKPIKEKKPVKEVKEDKKPAVARKAPGRKKKEVKETVVESASEEEAPPVEKAVKVKKAPGRKKVVKEAVESASEEETPVVEAKEDAKKAADPENDDKEEVEAASEEKEPPVVKTKKAPGRQKKEVKPVEPVAEAEEVEAVVEEKKDKEKAPLQNSTTTEWDKIDFSCAKEFTKKITSWNVDGLRAWLKKDGLAILEHEKPDVFCLQETKCSDDKLPDEVREVEGYHTFWCASDKDGYAGVGLFSREEPLDVQYGLGVAEHDDEGRCITAEFEKFYVVCVYVPNAGRKLVTLPKRLEWNVAFKQYVKELDAKKPVVVCGDLNVAHNEIDLSNPKTNTKNAGFTKEERDGFTEFLSEGFVDTYRKLYPEEKDVYTFWSYITKARAKNVGWRLDYFVVSERFVDKVSDNLVRSKVFGSDHCPITLFINI